MKLLTNFTDHSHIQKIQELLKESQEVFIAVAFLKSSGLDMVIDKITELLTNKRKVTFICGLDFGLTEPIALSILLSLRNRYNSLSVFMNSNPDKKIVFHPKIYFFVHPENAYLIVGSANFTKGGFENNYECSVFTPIRKVDSIFNDVHSYFNQLISECESLNLINLLKYETFYKSQHEQRRGIKVKPDLGDKYAFNYQNLKSWFQKYKSTNDVDVLFKEKSWGYDQAEIILNTIADAKELKRQEFIPLFERLVQKTEGRKLWHSGSIYRKKEKVFDHIPQFQNLIRYIRENKNESPTLVFNESKKLVQNVGGSGVNTVTEIMMTFNRNKFANLNENPINVLMNQAGVTIKKHRNSFSGHDYELYCNLAKEISEALELRNMLEVDSFFNDIYWETKKRNK
jgi:HKD family nuclease